MTPAAYVHSVRSAPLWFKKYRASSALVAVYPVVIGFVFSCFRGLLLSRSAFEEFGYRLPGDRILHVRGNFGERLEHESPLAEARVRHDQPGLVDGGITEEHEVEIQAARCIQVGTLATPLVFDGQQRFEELVCRHRRLPYCCGIQEQRLRTRRTDGNRVVEA